MKESPPGMLSSFLGSWEFILLETLFILAWMLINTIHSFPHWDPYPFPFLTNLLVCEAAFSAPFILLHLRKKLIREQEYTTYVVEMLQYLEQQNRQLQESLKREQRIM